jgi:SAM-dependent methyltransferase
MVETIQPTSAATPSYYDTYWEDAGLELRSGETRGVYGDLPELVGRHLARLLPPQSLCLDVGCGDGQTAGLWLREQGHRYIGVDVSSEGVRRAQSVGLDARLIEQATSLPFPDDYFDAVVCIEVLEHLFAPLQAVAEIRRVLKPGGLFVGTTPNVSHVRRRVELGLFGTWNPLGDALSVDEPWRDPHIRFFTPWTLADMVERAGFSSVRVHGHQGWIRHVQSGGRAAALAKALLPGRAQRLAVGLLAVRLHVLARKAATAHAA